MRVRINPKICQGHGMCFMACPEIFQLSEEDGHAYLLIKDVPIELQSRVRLAVQCCPEQAIETDE
jgi:ferredoxin